MPPEPLGVSPPFPMRLQEYLSILTASNNERTYGLTWSTASLLGIRKASGAVLPYFTPVTVKGETATRASAIVVHIA